MTRGSYPSLRHKGTSRGTIRDSTAPDRKLTGTIHGPADCSIKGRVTSIAVAPPTPTARVGILVRPRKGIMRSAMLSRIMFARKDTEPRKGSPRSLMRTPERLYHPKPPERAMAFPGVRPNSGTSARLPPKVPITVAIGTAIAAGLTSVDLRLVPDWANWIPIKNRSMFNVHDVILLKSIRISGTSTPTAIPATTNARSESGDLRCMNMFTTLCLGCSRAVVSVSAPGPGERRRPFTKKAARIRVMIVPPIENMAVESARIPMVPRLERSSGLLPMRNPIPERRNQSTERIIDSRSLGAGAALVEATNAPDARKRSRMRICSIPSMHATLPETGILRQP